MNYFSVQKFLVVDPYACKTKKLKSENEIKEKVLIFKHEFEFETPSRSFAQLNNSHHSSHYSLHASLEHNTIHNAHQSSEAQDPSESSLPGSSERCVQLWTTV
jgi:hypothetical protein